MSNLLRILVPIGIAAAVAYVGINLMSSTPPAGPVPIVWDKEVCAHCRMHIGDPRFAAQLSTAGGRVASFDDPGCLLAYLESDAPAAAHTYFRHLREDRWIEADDVGFVSVTPTPMGFGIGAVDRSEPGAMPLDQVREMIRNGVLRGHRPAPGEPR